MTDSRNLYDDASPCLSEYGLPKFPNRPAAEAAIPEGWRNRPVLFRCGSGHHHVGHWPRTSPHPIPLPQEDK